MVRQLGKISNVPIHCLFANPFFCDPAAIVSQELKVHVSLLALRSRCLDGYLSRQKDDRNHGVTFLYVGLEFVVMDCITHSIQQKSRICVCV